MTDTDYDWSELNGTVVDRMTKEKIVPVHPNIVRQAQRSVDADGKREWRSKDDWATTVPIEKQFESDGKAMAFKKLMGKAGKHTKPVSSITVKVDPDGTGDNKLVRWKAGAPRGRQPGT